MQLDALGQEFINEIIPLLVKDLLEVTADNGFVGFGRQIITPLP